jgi:hypothetical protein
MTAQYVEFSRSRAVIDRPYSVVLSERRVFVQSRLSVTTLWHIVISTTETPLLPTSINGNRCYAAHAMLNTDNADFERMPGNGILNLENEEIAWLFEDFIAEVYHALANGRELPPDWSLRINMRLHALHAKNEVNQN